MSARRGADEPRGNTRKNAIAVGPASAREKTPGTKRRAEEASMHRLSRVPQKFAQKPETQTNFAIAFFDNHPDVAVDKRSPKDKIDDVDAKLAGDLEHETRFDLLVQKKSLCFLAYGENSPESVSAIADLGAFYNLQELPESALRHMRKASALMDDVDVDNELKFMIAVEMANSLLETPAQTTKEASRNVDEAGDILNEFVEAEAEDGMLHYRRDFLLARVAQCRKRGKEAMEMYERAEDTLNAENDNEVTSLTAELYHEMAKCAEENKKMNDANDFYKKAYKAYKSLGMDDEAQRVRSKVPGSNKKPKVERKQKKRVDSARVSGSYADSGSD